MKKNKLFMMGTLAMMLTFGLVLAGCKYDTDDWRDALNAPKGRLTINDIPAEHNGKYIYFFFSKGSDFYNGTNNVTAPDNNGYIYHLVRISNEKAVVPIYVLGTGGEKLSELHTPYEGNDNITNLTIYVSADSTMKIGDYSGLTAIKTIDTVTFIKGSATVSCRDKSSSVRAE